MPRLAILTLLTFLLGASQTGWAQTLERQLAAESAETLILAARQQGDPQRGAIVFYQPHMACTKCHVAGEDEQMLGPDLALAGKDATDQHLLESVLEPSKAIKKGFESMSVVTLGGQTFTGLLVEDEKDKVVLRDAANNFKLVTVPREEIDVAKLSDVSIMPAGQVNALASRQQFLDLLRYLIEIRDGGLARARELEPAPSLYAARPLPEYEKEIDHAGMISALDQAAYKRGEAIYTRLCINCHGTHDKPGSLPTSLRFASGKFKNGSDPYTMYQTLTRGFGMMVPQAWMVPEQKYDVIHYIRQAYLKDHNPTQHFDVNANYLARLPQGTTRGPKPSNIQPWSQMDYGPNLVGTFEVGSNAKNFAYKGNAIRLDHGPGGVSQGRYWLMFDYDTLRVAAAWGGTGFINWQGINFDGRHNIHPRIAGQVHFSNPTGPGWGHPDTGSFDDNQRVVGRDERIYGPLPRRWAHYKGMYYHGNDTLISYTVGDTTVLEMPRLDATTAVPVFQRVFNIGPRDKEMLLQVAHLPGANSISGASDRSYVVLGQDLAEGVNAPAPDRLSFNGSTHVEVADADDLNMLDKDFTVTARIKTKENGTIFCKTGRGSEWVPDGKTLFVRGGRLAYDIGWVGVVQGRSRVADGKWHNVAASYDNKAGRVRLYVDGKLDGEGNLRPKAGVKNHVVRIGYTAAEFPKPSAFNGTMGEVRFYQRQLGADELGDAAKLNDEGMVARWSLLEAKGAVRDLTGKKHDGQIVAGGRTGTSSVEGAIIAGVTGQIEGEDWQAPDGNLRLKIPAGDEPIRFTLWTANIDSLDAADPLAASLSLEDADQDLSRLTKGGPARWPAELTSKPRIGDSDGPFAVDYLTHPSTNPWFCRMRLTGFDFFDDGDRVAVSAWDGSVWLVRGLTTLNKEGAEPELKWRRIASGLFQPLGVKIVDGKIFVACRDQICILHDLNGDGETDYFESFNNDHQVTDHFHEFAMGLQRDREGNFYYAKSARHALTALVPHHGTLLRVNKDGSRTDILATGFRAANGVCLNPDGTFIVTDQEGHWNPKNRINWVREGGFYGNMFGYHDVTDSSDEAMDQPLCWITNSFDRSPSELLWVDSKKWGPLNGSLLNFSYGYGKVYIVPHEEVRGQKQGGMSPFPIPQFPTGVMRGRFHPGDGQLYTCGMFAWAGSQHQPGGFYRIRYTGKPVHLPVDLAATKKGIELTFSGEVDPESAAAPKNYAIKVWSLKRTASYGSRHYDEKPLKVSSATVSDDGRSVLLKIPGIAPTWCMEIKYRLKTTDGKPFDGVIHNTIHHLGE